MGPARSELRSGEKLPVRVKAADALGTPRTLGRWQRCPCCTYRFFTETVGRGPSPAGWVLDLAGFLGDGPAAEAAIWTIRVLRRPVPACFLAMAIAIARGHPIRRTPHAEVLARLARSRVDSGAP